MAFMIVNLSAMAAEEGDKTADASKEDGKKDDKKKDDKKKDKGDEDVSGGKFAGDPVYVRLPPMTLPIILESGVEQLVTLQIAVEVKDFSVGDQIHSNMPRVMDALNSSLYGALGDGSVRNGRMVSPEKIKARAGAALRRVLGADNIKQVLLLTLSQRML